MSLLSVQNLNIRTTSTPLVHNVSFTVEPGETVALVGESGSGKTLTALSILGLLAPELAVKADKMTFTGPNGPVELNQLKPAALRALRGRVISMIFQEPATALNPVLTCGYQVAEAFFIHTSLSRAEAKKKVLGLFERVHLLDVERIFRSYPHQLSGGQRQRMMIAMALAHQPKLLIADEPTTALDVTVQAEILKLVQELQQDLGMAMLWITHDFGVVRELANRVVVMQQGKVVEAGAAGQVLNHPAHAYTRQLLAATVSLNLEPVPPAPINKGGAKSILVASKLNLSYGQKPFLDFWPFNTGPAPLPALKNVGFSLNAGETLGVVGESGSGKSTLARVLTRLLPAEPDAQGQGGSILLLGENFLALRGTELRKKRRNLQMVFQDPSAALNPRMRVGDAIAEGVRVHSVRPKNEIRRYVEDLLKDVGLPANAYTRYPHQLSGGQKQRLCIARALALQPKVIIADEAVSALDVSVQAQILTLLKKLQAEHGTSYIFISHDLRVVSQLAQNVLVMHRGNVVEAGPTATVFAKPQHSYTKHLLSAVLETDPLTGALGEAPVAGSVKSGPGPTAKRAVKKARSK